MTYSRVTLEPLPTLSTVIDEMLLVYMDERGYGDFFDSYKTIAQSDLKEVGTLLYNKMMDMSDKAMLENRRCPECGGKLINRGLYFECTECRDEINKEAV